MITTARREPALHATDAIWDGIRTTAEGIAAREPLLFRRMQHTILARNNPASILATVLARPLANADLPEQALYTLIFEVFSEDEHTLAHTTADLDAVKERDPACPHHLHVLLNLKGFHALQTYRVSHWLWTEGRRELAVMLSNLASRVFNVDIHPAARIAGGVMLDHGSGIVIGETSVIEENVSLLQNVTLGGTGKEQGDRHPKVQSGVMIGAGAKILGNIQIGAMSKVAAGSVVLQNVPPHSTVAGVPAKVVRLHRNEDFPAMEMQQTI